jgi:hypothetical protein
MSVRAPGKDALRRVPGLVALKRGLVAAYRRVRPLRPPVEAPHVVRRMLVRPEDDRFINGNGFAARCRHVLNYDVVRVDDDVDNDWWFCNPEFLEYFFRHLAPDEEYVLVTHNSNVDRAIDRAFAKRLEDPRLVAWLAINVELRHPRLHAIPLGVGNPLKCDHRALRRVQEEQRPKTELFEVSFDVRTNERERRYCIEQTGLTPMPKLDRGYFERLASSYFCLSPAGNGVDCYRTWQALYLRTIPVVTRTVLTEQHPDLPMVVLDDWADFRSIAFTPELYERTWSDWDPAELALDRYLERVSARLPRRAAAVGSSAVARG